MYAFPSQFSYCASLKPEIIEEESKMGSEKNEETNWQWNKKGS